MEIFPGLPEEIGRECLLRVAYKFHRKLRGVCRKWKTVVNSSEYKEEQVRRGICEELVETIPMSASEFPTIAVLNMVSVNGNLIFVRASEEVMIVYNFKEGRWMKRETFPGTNAHSFASAVSPAAEIFIA
ncbi:hypothetical protein KI387_022762 [Taxus chinensis]|uniref:F-box domain-containing protein n=1 Tax=Taxus chinensis TaxID=29808 RepID=A0AA38LA77_TAXCH|nr:hypothetical protein KI387_022762 [Taxus chinensis]